MAVSLGAELLSSERGQLGREACSLTRQCMREATTTRGRMRSSCVSRSDSTKGRAIGSNVVAHSCAVERDRIPDHRGTGGRPPPEAG